MADGLERRLRRALLALASVAAVAACAGTWMPRLGFGAASGSAREAAAPLAAVVGFLATVAVAAAVCARAPRRYAHLLGVLAAGFLAAAAASAGADVASLARAGVAAAIGLAAALVQAALWCAERPGEATAHRDAELLRAALEAIVPDGGRVAFGATDAAVAGRLREAYACSGPHGLLRLRLALRLAALACRLAGSGAFERAEIEARQRVIERLLTARLRALGQGVDELRRCALEAFYGDPRVQSAIGYDAAYVRTRLEQGPNGEAHRARMEATAADAGERSGDEPGDGPTRIDAGSRVPPLRLVRGGPTRP